MPVESYSNYIDQLIETRALFLVKDETRERLSDLFLNYVPFPCLAENDPSSRKLGRELVEAEVVGLTSPDKWPDFTDGHEVLAAFRRATASSSLLVCLPQKGPVKERTYWYSAVYGLLGDPTGLLISSIPGVVFDLISTSARAQEEWRELHKRVGWRSVHLSNQIISRQGDTAPVLAHGSSSLDAYLFNARHPLIAPIPYVFLNSLSGRISEILQELAKGTALIKKTRDNQFIDRYRHPNFVLVGVLKRAPAFLDSLREAFAKTWREAHAGDATSQFPGLTAEDLPWFWSYEE